MRENERDALREVREKERNVSVKRTTIAKERNRERERETERLPVCRDV
jgi:hypothetical protein